MKIMFAQNPRITSLLYLKYDMLAGIWKWFVSIEKK